MKRIVGIDLGDRRIGVAVSDPLRVTAQILATVVREAHWLGTLDKVLQPYGIERIVVGLPVQPDGSEGERAMAYRRVARRLAQRYGCEMDLWDERESTRAVERVLLAGNVRRQKRRQISDRCAAAWMLQGYLDHSRKEGFP